MQQLWLAFIDYIGDSHVNLKFLTDNVDSIFLVVFLVFFRVKMHLDDHKYFKNFEEEESKCKYFWISDCGSRVVLYGAFRRNNQGYGDFSCYFGGSVCLIHRADSSSFDGNCAKLKFKIDIANYSSTPSQMDNYKYVLYYISYSLFLRCKNHAVNFWSSSRHQQVGLYYCYDHRHDLRSCG